MPSILNTKYTAIDLSGATSTLDITEGYDSYVYYGTGSLLNNYTISPSASPSSTTQFTIVKTGNIDLNGYNLTIFGETLSQEQASSDLIITCIYDLVNAVWAVNIEINSLSLPSIIEGVETTTVPTSGTKTLLPNLNSKWQVFSGSQTLAGNYTIDGTGVQNGDEFWVIWDSQCDINGNTLSIFGITIPQEDAASGNFIVVAKYNGSTWEAKYLNNQFILFTEGTGTYSIRKANGVSNAASGYAAVNLSSSNSSDASGDYSTNIAFQGQASGDYSFTQGIDTIASGNNSSAYGNSSTASASNAFAKGSNTTASGQNSETSGEQTIASETNSIAQGFKSNAKWQAARVLSSGNNANNVNKPNQKVEIQLYKTTTDATLTELFIDGSALRVTVTPNSAMLVKGTITGIQQAGSSGSVGDTKSWDFIAKLTNISGTTTLKPVDQEGSGIIYTGALRNIPNVHLTGTAQAGAASTITLDPSAPDVNDWFNNTYVTIINGTGVGQSKLITGFVGSTLVATIDGTWTTNPDNTSEYIIETGIGVTSNTNSWYVEPDVNDTVDAFTIKVRGEANKTIYWHAVLDIQEVCY